MIAQLCILANIDNICIMHEVEEKCTMSDAVYYYLTCSGWKIKDARLPSMALIACFIRILLLRTSSGQYLALPRLSELSASSI